MGEPLTGTESQSQIERQAGELKKLYIEALRSFSQVLKPRGTVVFIIPRFHTKNSWVTINCAAEIKKIGLSSYPLLPGHDSLLYWRPGQHVGREIWRFKKSL